MESTKSKIVSIARKYGYYANAYMDDYGSHKVPVISFTATESTVRSRIVDLSDKISRC